MFDPYNISDRGQKMITVLDRIELKEIIFAGIKLIHDEF